MHASRAAGAFAKEPTRRHSGKAPKKKPRHFVYFVRPHTRVCACTCDVMPVCACACTRVRAHLVTVRKKETLNLLRCLALQRLKSCSPSLVGTGNKIFSLYKAKSVIGLCPKLNYHRQKHCRTACSNPLVRRQLSTECMTLDPLRKSVHRCAREEADQGG